MRALTVLLVLVLGCENTKPTPPPKPLEASALASTDLVRAEEGVVGATCYAKPSCPACKNVTTNDPEPGTNVCKQFEQFYPGVTMVLAKKHAIKKCQELNSLDECGNHCKNNAQVRAANSGGCYKQCEAKTHCIYGDNR